MTVSENQVETFVAALPYRDFHDRDLVRAAIAAAQEGGGLSKATRVLLNGHEPNWLPGVETMVGGALHRAGVAPTAADRPPATDLQINSFLEALNGWMPDDRVLAQEAIDAAARWETTASGWPQASCSSAPR